MRGGGGEADDDEADTRMCGRSASATSSVSTGQDASNSQFLKCFRTGLIFFKGQNNVFQQSYSL